MMVSSSLVDEDAALFRTVLYRERRQRMMRVATLGVSLGILALVIVLLFRTDNTTTAIRDSQVNGSKSVRVATSAAVACAFALRNPDYEDIYECVEDTVNRELSNP